MAASESITTFVMVPGSFSGPWLYSKVIALLSSAPCSFPTSSLHTVSLLSATPSRPEGPATTDDDAAAIASKIYALADEARDIVLVMSSYGGFPGTQASFGLSKASRSKKRLRGGIISLVYIAAHMPQVGQCTSDFGAGLPAGDAYMSVEYSPEMAQAVFPDMPDPEEHKRYFEMMSDHSRVSFDWQAEACEVGRR